MTRNFQLGDELHSLGNLETYTIENEQDPNHEDAAVMLEGTGLSRILRQH
jgi:hypothetical protein